VIDSAWAPLAGAAVGLVVGLTGVGGGALMAPVLLLGFGLPLPVVVATDLLFATMTKIAAGAVHQRSGSVDWEIVRRLWVGSLPATLGVVLLVRSGFAFEHSGAITTLLGVLVFASGCAMLLGGRLQARQTARRLASPVDFKRFQREMTWSAGFGLGTLVTLTSVGAGALGVVILRALYPLRMTPARLVATDTVHAIPVTLLGGVSLLLMGFTDLGLLGTLLLGSIPAALVGGWLANRVPSGALRAVLAVALIGAGMRLAF
jgi:uncharacterized membrane protein YfcA